MNTQQPEARGPNDRLIRIVCIIVIAYVALHVLLAVAQAVAGAIFVNRIFDDIFRAGTGR